MSDTDKMKNEPAPNEGDQFPQAMIEATTEYDWAELPDWLKDVIRHAADEFRRWADEQDSPIVGEVVAQGSALRSARTALESAAPHMIPLGTRTLEMPPDFLSDDEYRAARNDIAERIAKVDRTISWDASPESAGFYATALLSAGYRASRVPNYDGARK